MKLELSNELKSEIDLLLRNLLKGGQCSDNKDNSELIKESIRVCKVLKLIELTHSGKQYQLCEKGILVIDDGGIEKYLGNIKIGNDLDNEIKFFTGKRLKDDVNNNIKYIALGGFIGLITSISTTVLTLKATPDNTIKYIEQLNKLTSEKTEHDYNLQKHLNDMNIELSLLKNQIDSLKIKKSE